MSVAKIIEISADSQKSFEDAIRQGIERAGQTLKNIQSAWIKEQQVMVNDQKVAGYRVILKITFVLN
ncbi:MAG TPA: dodecin family protein [Gammaproteobacteria bacterium]|nr:dodecin family protein [Gammaproteobacteria bacterium]